MAAKQTIADALGAIDTERIWFDEPMSRHASLGLGGVVDALVAPENEQQLKDAEQWLKKILLANKKCNVLDENYFGKIILERWLRFCYNYMGGRKGIKYFMSSELRNSIKLPLKQKFEFYKNLYITYKRKGIKG